LFPILQKDTSASGAGALSPIQSPLASEPATCSPLTYMSQFNVQLSGVNAFANNIQYSWESFLTELQSTGLNGNLTRGLCSGLISKEMFEAKSFFVPLFHGEPHWSKPPFQFWLAYSSYSFFGGVSLLAARVSILIFSMSMLFLIALWMKRSFVALNSNLMESFVFLTASFGFIKYSRIFMMEMPLSLLATYSILLFYFYLEKRNVIFFIWSVFFMA
jgi:hypothetical protein